MSAQVTYRMARPDDSGELARYMCIAGGGVYEFLFDDLIPFVNAVDLLWQPSAVTARSSPLRMCFPPTC